MDIKVLVIAADGQLGRLVQERCAGYTQIDFRFTTLDDLDVTKADALEKMVKSQHCILLPKHWTELMTC